MFNKKAKVTIERIEEADECRLLIEYFKVKKKDQFRTELISALIANEDPVFVMIDSNFFNKSKEDKEHQWVSNLKHWLEEDEVKYELKKAKKEASTGMLGSILNSKKNSKDNYAYRISMMIDKTNFDTMIEYHDQVKLGIHIGLQIKPENEKEIMREFCLGVLEPFNRFDYYSIDIFDYLEVGRMVIRTNSVTELDIIQKKVETKVDELVTQ